MPNISFEERQGASLLRRILAGFWIVLALGSGIAFVNYTPRVYRSSMELCYNEGNKGEVLARVTSVLKKSAVLGVATDSVDKERLTITSTASSKAKVIANLTRIQDEIRESLRADIESTYNTRKQEYDNELAAFNERLAIIKTENSETDGYYSIIDELEDALKNHGMLPVGWEVMFEDNARFHSILNELVSNISLVEEIGIELKTQASKMLVLSEWVNAPENQSTQIKEKRVVYHNDSPELIALKDQKAAIEASRMRLLNRATSLHPMVIKMSEEIDELQAQINALTRLPQVVEDVREITNPEVAEFKSKIVANRSIIASLNSKIDTLINKTLMRLSDLRVLVGDAQKDKVAGREEKLLNDIKLFKNTPVKIETSPILGYIISDSMHRIDGPNLYIIYGLAAFIGLTGAGLILYSAKKSSFKLEEVEATPEFPVLGKIGRIGGSTITTTNE